MQKGQNATKFDSKKKTQTLMYQKQKELKLKKDYEKENDHKKVLNQMIKKPETLKMLILSGTDLVSSSLEVINNCDKLIKLDLSSNKIVNFPIEFKIYRLKNLKLLYLHDNHIDNIETIEQTFQLINLRYLTIFSNPVTKLQGIRHRIVNQIPSLMALDFNIVGDDERYQNLMIYKENTNDTKLNWPLVNLPPGETFNERAYLKMMQKELEIVRKKYESSSLVVKVQAYIKGFLVRKSSVAQQKQYLQRVKKIQRIVVDKWFQFVKKKKKIHLKLQMRNYKIINHQLISEERLNNIIQRMKRYLEKVKQARKQKNAYNLLNKNIKKYRQNLLHSLNSQNILKNQGMYIRRDQLDIFILILKMTQIRIESYPSFNENNILELLKNLIEDIQQIIEYNKTHQYDLPDQFSYDYNSNFNQLSQENSKINGSQFQNQNQMFCNNNENQINKQNSHYHRSHSTSPQKLEKNQFFSNKLSSQQNSLNQRLQKRKSTILNLNQIQNMSSSKDSYSNSNLQSPIKLQKYKTSSFQNSQILRKFQTGIQEQQQQQKNERPFININKNILTIRTFDPKQPNIQHYFETCQQQFQNPSTNSQVLFLQNRQGYYRRMTQLPFIKYFDQRVKINRINNKFFVKKNQITLQQKEKIKEVASQIEKFQKKVYQNQIYQFYCPDSNLLTLICQQIYIYNLENKRFLADRGYQSKFKELFKLYKEFVQNQNKEKSHEFGIESDSSNLPKISELNTVEQDSKSIQMPSIPEQLKLILLQKQQFFMVYNQHELVRVSSALKIQSFWKKYILIKYQKSAHQLIVQERAVRRLQLFAREFKYNHRKQLLHNLQKYQKALQGDTLYIQEKIYMKLEGITNSQRNIGAKILEQFHFISFYPNQKLVRLQWDINQDENIKHISTVRKVLPFKIKNLKELDQTDNDYYIADIMHIIHSNSQVFRAEFNKEKYIGFKFESDAEMKYRALSFGLHTYRFEQGGSYIKLFDFQMLQNFKQVNEYEKSIFRIYGISLNSEYIEPNLEDNNNIQKVKSQKQQKLIQNKFNVDKCFFICQNISKEMTQNFMENSDFNLIKQLRMFKDIIKIAQQGQQIKQPIKLSQNVLICQQNNIYINKNESIKNKIKKEKDMIRKQEEAEFNISLQQLIKNKPKILYITQQDFQELEEFNQHDELSQFSNHSDKQSIYNKNNKNKSKSKEQIFGNRKFRTINANELPKLEQIQIPRLSLVEAKEREKEIQRQKQENVYLYLKNEEDKKRILKKEKEVEIEEKQYRAVIDKINRKDTIERNLENDLDLKQQKVNQIQKYKKNQDKQDEILFTNKFSKLTNVVVKQQAIFNHYQQKQENQQLQKAIVQIRKRDRSKNYSIGQEGKNELILKNQLNQDIEHKNMKLKKDQILQKLSIQFDQNLINNKNPFSKNNTLNLSDQLKMGDNMLQSNGQKAYSLRSRRQSLSQQNKQINQQTEVQNSIQNSQRQLEKQYYVMKNQLDIQKAQMNAQKKNEFNYNYHRNFKYEKRTRAFSQYDIQNNFEAIQRDQYGNNKINFDKRKLSLQPQNRSEQEYIKNQQQQLINKKQYKDKALQKGSKNQSLNNSQQKFQKHISPSQSQNSEIKLILEVDSIGHEILDANKDIMLNKNKQSDSKQSNNSESVHNSMFNAKNSFQLRQKYSIIDDEIQINLPKIQNNKKINQLFIQNNQKVHNVLFTNQFDY